MASPSTMLRQRYIYLVLCVVGVFLPYWQFVPWFLDHGLDIPLFVQQLFANRIGAFFGLDVLVSSLVLWIFVFAEGGRLGMRRLWVPVSALSCLAYRSDCRFFFTCASFTLIKPRSNQPILPTPNVFASELAGRPNASLSVMQTRCNSGSLSPAVADLELVRPMRTLVATSPFTSTFAARS